MDKLNSNLFTHCNSLENTDFIFNNGKVYTPEYPKAQGHPYLFDKSFKKGQIIIKDKTYENVDILLDIHRDRVICLSQLVKDVRYPIIIPKAFIKKIQVNNAYFINNQDTGNGLDNGFYQILFHENKIYCLVKNQKKLLKRFTKEFQGEYFNVRRAFFFWVKDKFIPVENIKELATLYGVDYKKLKPFIKKERISFKKSEDEKLISFFQYFANAQ